jgi:hypothetical protein
MSMYLRLLGIAAVMSGFGLSEALPAGDVWKGSWKFEIDRQDQPWLGYYDTRGKTVLRIGCGAHFDMRAVYPAAPKRDDTKASITIANGEMQMDFAGVIDAGTEYDPPHTTIFDQPDLGYARDDPELYEDKWHALESLRSSGLRAAADDLGRRQKLRATADQRAALAGALPENLLTRRRDRAVLRRASPSLAPAVAWSA